MMIQALLRLQERHGYLPQEGLRELARDLRLPLHRLHEVASYYPLFRLQPPPRVQVQVCRDMSCHLRGAAQLAADLKNKLGDSGDTIVEGVSCLGRCDGAPAV